MGQKAPPGGADKEGDGRRNMTSSDSYFVNHTFSQKNCRYWSQTHSYVKTGTDSVFNNDPYFLKFNLVYLIALLLGAFVEALVEAILS